MKFAIGEEVSWTDSNARGKSVSMKLCQGIITQLDNEYAVVRISSGRRKQIALQRLRKQGEKSQISEFVEVLFGREL